MLKFFRWLLVPLFPLVGLIVGFWLMPDRGPRWQKNYDYVINILGHVDGGRTLLIGEVTSQGEQSLSGVDVESGEERFRIMLTREFLKAKANQIREAKLTDDGKYVIFPAEHYTLDNEKQIMLFDWRAKQVTHRFWMKTEGIVSAVSQKGTTLLAHVGSNVCVWAMDTPYSPVIIALDFSASQLELSHDATVVHNRRAQLTAIDRSKRTFGYQLRLFDLNKNVSLPVIDGEYSNLYWSTDSQKFTAIMNEPVKKSLIKRTFIRSPEGFTHVPEQDHDFHTTGTLVEDQNYTVIASRAKFAPLRMKAANLLGSSLAPLVDRLWPDAQTFHLFDRSTSSELHQLTLPTSDRPIPNLRINTNQEGLGIALWNERWLYYWDLYPASRWYPLLGLAVGILLATLLTWRLLRLQPNPRQTPPVMSEVATP